MKTISLISFLLLLGFFLVNCEKKDHSPTKDPKVEKKMSHEDHVKRGAYLAQMMGCHDCHSPKIMTPEGPISDPNRLLSGHPASEKLPEVADKMILTDYVLFNMGSTASIGPWGTSFSGNLTPDDSGTGNWTLENFERAVRQGKHKGLETGRMLLPPMPWQHFSQMSNDDLAALWAYLQSLQPVRNIVPPPIPPVG